MDRISDRSNCVQFVRWFRGVLFKVLFIGTLSLTYLCLSTTTSSSVVTCFTVINYLWKSSHSYPEEGSNMFILTFGCTYKTTLHYISDKYNLIYLLPRESKNLIQPRVFRGLLLSNWTPALQEMQRRKSECIVKRSTYINHVLLLKARTAHRSASRCSCSAFSYVLYPFN
jgi:hypothetical protein